MIADSDSEVEIRRARPGEAAAITQLKMVSKKSNGYTDAFMHACAVELHVSEKDLELLEIWVADLKNEIVGMLDVRFERELCYLEALFVDPDIKGGGIGRKLFEKCETRSREEGVHRIDVDSDPEAQAFYEKMGMKKTGEIPSGSIAGRFLPRLSIQLN